LRKSKLLRWPAKSKSARLGTVALFYHFICLKIMAKNGKSGDGHRHGAVKDRSQFQHPQSKLWVKRDTDTGQFIGVKKDGEKFKGVRREKTDKSD
jgi:hypothetical protein